MSQLHWSGVEVFPNAQLPWQPHEPEQPPVMHFWGLLEHQWPWTLRGGCGEQSCETVDVNRTTTRAVLTRPAPSPKRNGPADARH